MRFVSYIKKLVRPIYHLIRAWVAAARYGFPARKLKLIGITGTKGKTSTTVLTGRLLQQAGIRSGYISTAELSDGKTVTPNRYHMTTIDPFVMQRELSNMVHYKCKWAVLEMSSQGLEAGRHHGLFGFDIAVFLNIFPEHIQAHGTFEKYLKAKGILFESLRDGATVFVNDESEYANTILSMIPSYQFATINKKLIKPHGEFTVVDTKYALYKAMQINGELIKTHFLADFELENAYFALRIASMITTGEVLDTRLLPLLDTLGTIPGRMSFVVESPQVDILVDYAHEPESMKRLLSNVRSWIDNGHYTKFVHVVSCDGAGRDDWKKPMMGKLSSEYADYSVVTVDNYDTGDDPQQIVNILSSEFEQSRIGLKFAKVIDRRSAFVEALGWARRQPGKVLIVSTGVGNEYGLTRPGGRIDWDETKVWQEVFDKSGE